MAAEAFDEVDDGACGAAGGEEVVDDEDAMAFADCVAVHFERVLTVFEVVRNGDLFGGQLVWFADGHEARVEFDGERRGEDKSARFDADDGVDLFIADET